MDLSTSQTDTVRAGMHVMTRNPLLQESFRFHPATIPRCPHRQSSSSYSDRLRTNTSIQRFQSSELSLDRPTTQRLQASRLPFSNGPRSRPCLPSLPEIWARRVLVAIPASRPRNQRSIASGSMEDCPGNNRRNADINLDSPKQIVSSYRLRHEADLLTHRSGKVE